MMLPVSTPLDHAFWCHFPLKSLSCEEDDAGLSNNFSGRLAEMATLREFVGLGVCELHVWPMLLPKPMNGQAT
jgi:hypothetical protein